MTEEAVQTPQGEVGASDGVEQSVTAEEEKGKSLLGADAPADEGEEKVEEQEDNSALEGDDDVDDSPLDAEEESEEEKAEGAPESYEDFKVPEGMDLDNKALEQAAPVFKELGLNQDKAQKLVDTYAELQQQAISEQKAAVDKMRAEWAEEITSDPEHKQTLANAKKAVEVFGDDGLKGLLYNEWLGDHPSMVKFLGKIGAAMNNDQFVEGGSSAGSKELPEALFDDMPGL